MCRREHGNVCAWYPEHQEEIIYCPNMKKKKSKGKKEGRETRER